MTQQPWKTDKWFVSPWNFEDAVRAEFHFPGNIQIQEFSLDRKWLLTQLEFESIVSKTLPARAGAA